MFDTHPHSKRLGFHSHALCQQHLIGIPGRVSDAKEYHISRDAFLTINDNRPDSSLHEFQIRHLAAKADLAAKPDDLLPNIADNAPQQIRPDMWLMQIADFLRRTSFDERRDDILHMPVINACGELSIRERSCSALAKLNIGLHIQCPPLPEPLDILMTGIHILPAFQHERLPAGLSQRKCRKHARGAKANDYRALCSRRQYPAHCRSHRFCQDLFYIPVLMHFLHNLLLIYGQANIQHIDKLHGRTMITTRIHSLTHNYHLKHSLRW